MSGRHHCAQIPAETDAYLCPKEDIGDQYSDINIDDNDTDPDYVFDLKNEDQEFEAEYFHVLPPHSHTSTSLKTGTLHAPILSSSSNTRLYLF